MEYFRRSKFEEKFELARAKSVHLETIRHHINVVSTSLLKEVTALSLTKSKVNEPWTDDHIAKGRIRCRPIVVLEEIKLLSTANENELSLQLEENKDSPKQVGKEDLNSESFHEKADRLVQMVQGAQDKFERQSANLDQIYSLATKLINDSHLSYKLKQDVLYIKLMLTPPEGAPAVEEKERGYYSS